MQGVQELISRQTRHGSGDDECSPRGVPPTSLPDDGVQNALNLPAYPAFLSDVLLTDAADIDFATYGNRNTRDVKSIQPANAK